MGDLARSHIMSSVYEALPIIEDLQRAKILLLHLYYRGEFYGLLCVLLHLSDGEPSTAQRKLFGVFSFFFRQVGKPEKDKKKMFCYSNLCTFDKTTRCRDLCTKAHYAHPVTQGETHNAVTSCQPNKHLLTLLSTSLANLCRETGLDGGNTTTGTTRVAGNEVQSVLSLVEFSIWGSAGLAGNVFHDISP